MEKKNLENYVAPVVTQLVISAETVFCGSPVPPGGIERGEEGEDL